MSFEKMKKKTTLFEMNGKKTAVLGLLDIAMCPMFPNKSHICRFNACILKFGIILEQSWLMF